MNDLGEHISTIKTNKIKPILLSIIFMSIIVTISYSISYDLMLSHSKVRSITSYMLALLISQIALIAFAHYGVNILIVLVNSRVIKLYEKGIVIRNFKCNYNDLYLYKVNSLVKSKLVFKSEHSSIIVVGYIKIKDYDLILEKIKPNLETESQMEENKELLKRP